MKKEEIAEKLIEMNPYHKDKKKDSYLEAVKNLCKILNIDHKQFSELR